QGIVMTLGDSRIHLNQQILDHLSGLTGAEFLLFDSGGQRLATISGQAGELPPADVMSNELSKPVLGNRVLVEERAYLCRGVKMRFPNPNAGATLYVLYPESLLEQAIWQAIRPSLVLGISGGLAALTITLMGGQRMVWRIQDLERRTRLIAGGDFSPMPLPRQNDEMHDLAVSINEMAAKLAQYREVVTRSERARLLDQVSGGLAHQLRNAVTGAKLAVQLHAETCAGGDREALMVAERQLSRMATDLKRFFDLGRTGQRHEQCSLSAMVADAVSLLRPQCEHAH